MLIARAERGGIEAGKETRSNRDVHDRRRQWMRLRRSNPVRGIRLERRQRQPMRSYVRDASGNVLAYGDSVALSKDLKV
ncbi:PhnA domain-containing protein [Ensifer sp. CCNWLY38]|uniref:PhnA domain-containing protein n=1 Tax=unclassified Ensifer TaxID=2633371 RepID=UPI003FA533C8